MKEEEENAKLMSQLDSLQQDDDLMKGLEEMEKLENERNEKSKKVYSPRDQAQGQGEQQEDDQKKNSGGGSNFGLISVILAIGVAGAIFAYNSLKKRV